MYKFSIILLLLFIIGCSKPPAVETLNTSLQYLQESILKSKLIEQALRNKDKNIYKIDDNTIIIFSQNNLCISNQNTCFQNENELADFLADCNQFSEYFIANFYNATILYYSEKDCNIGKITKGHNGEYYCNVKIILSMNVKQAILEPGIPIYSLTPPQWDKKTSTEKRLQHIRHNAEEFSKSLTPSIDHLYIYMKSNQAIDSWTNTQDSIACNITLIWNKQKQTWEIKDGINTSNISLENIPLLKNEYSSIDNIKSSLASTNIIVYNNNLWDVESLEYQKNLNKGLIYFDNQWVTKEEIDIQNQLNNFRNKIIKSSKSSESSLKTLLFDSNNLTLNNYQYIVKTIDDYLHFVKNHSDERLVIKTKDEINIACKEIIYNMLTSIKNSSLSRGNFNILITDFYNKVSTDSTWNLFFNEQLLNTINNTVYENTLKYLYNSYTLNISNKQISINNLQSYLQQTSWFFEDSKYQGLKLDKQNHLKLYKDISNKVVTYSIRLFDSFIFNFDIKNFQDFITLIEKDRSFQPFQAALAPIKSESITKFKDYLEQKSKIMAQNLKRNYSTVDNKRTVEGLESIINFVTLFKRANIIKSNECKQYAKLIANEYCKLDCPIPHQEFDEKKLQEEIDKLKKNTDFSKLEKQTYTKLKNQYKTYKRGDSVTVKDDHAEFIIYYPEERKIKYRGNDGQYNFISIDKIKTPDNIPAEVLFDSKKLDNYCLEQAKAQIEKKKKHIENANIWLREEMIQEINDTNIKNGYILYKNKWLSPGEILEELLKTFDEK